MLNVDFFELAADQEHLKRLKRRAASMRRNGAITTDEEQAVMKFLTAEWDRQIKAANAGRYSK